MMTKRAALQKLKSELRKVGLTQTWAAKRLGIAGPYLNRLFAGGGSPSDELHERIVALCSALEASGLETA